MPLGTALKPWEPGGAAQDRRTWHGFTSGHELLQQEQSWGWMSHGRDCRTGEQPQASSFSAAVCGGGFSRRQSSALRSQLAQGAIRPLTFSFSMREGMKLRLSAGRFVTGWIMTSWVKKSTAGCGDTDPSHPARPGATQRSEQAQRVCRDPTS